jgi:hypothetical protein
MHHLRGLACGALFLLLAVVSAGAQTLTAVLQGGNEVPPNDSPATGEGVFVYDRVTGMLDYTVHYRGIATLTEAHLHGPVDHAGAPATAPVLFLLDTANPLHGSLGPLSLQQASDFLATRWYINIHSLAHPTGEIRGQILPPGSVEPRTWGAVKSLYAP